jgi:hypothetical protein
MAENGERRDPSSHRTPAQIKRQVRGYNAQPDKIRKRSMNKAARRQLEKEGLVRPNDGKDVDHKKPLRSGGTNARSNLRAMDRSKNRAWRAKP